MVYFKSIEQNNVPVSIVLIKYLVVVWKNTLSMIKLETHLYSIKLLALAFSSKYFTKHNVKLHKVEYF